jgi:GntR family transcriptional repressor for pyruvate dehydrogenase complex
LSTRVTQQIIEAVRQDIASGNLPRDARLPAERDLARHFRVSQPTVREAIRVLEAMGLIDVRHGSGLYVANDPRRFIAKSLLTLLQIEQVAIMDVFEIRLALGKYSVGRAVHSATDEDIAAIEAEHEAWAALADGDWTNVRRVGVTFQAALSAATHSPLLFAIESVLGEILTIFQVEAFSKRSPATRARQRRAHAADRKLIIDALRARDERAAVTALGDYLASELRRLSRDRGIATLRFSDPEAMNVVDSARIDELFAASESLWRR